MIEVLRLLVVYGEILENAGNHDGLEQLKAMGLVEVSEVDQRGLVWYKLVDTPRTNLIILGILRSEP